MLHTANTTGDSRSSARRTIAATATALLIAAGIPAFEDHSQARAAVPPTVTKFTEQLPIPGVIDLTGDATTVALSAVSGTHRFHQGLPPTPSWGYTATGSTPDDVYLGPTLEVVRGKPVELTVTNTLSGHPLAAVIDTTLHGVSELDKTAPRIATHLHGGHTPPLYDGGPDDTFRKAGIATPESEVDFADGSGTFTYRYPNDQEAATLWYHDHALGITRLNVMAGLAGFYLVRDAFDTGDPGNPLGLPTGAREVPLVLQDRSFNPDGTLSYPVGPWATPGCEQATWSALTPCQWLPEFFGDVATVNGKAWPNHQVAAEVYRFRLLNGSNARVYDLKLQAPAGVANATIYQIGTDGGLLNAPVKTGRLVLAPGERADLLIDFRAVPAGTRIVMANNAPTPYPNGPRAARRGGAPLPQIMQFTVGAASGQSAAVPTTLRGGPGQPALLAPLTPVRTRTVALNEIMGTDPAGMPAPLTALLNNTGYHDATMGDALPESPRLNSVEEWQIVNTTGDTHPIHLHLTQYQVKNRQKIDAAAYLAAWNPMLPMPIASGTGPVPPPDPALYLAGRPKAPTADERGWKDTVRANPGEVTRILVPFGGTAAGVAAPFTGDAPDEVQRFVGRYVWHCHILEHEDNDMMLPYDVVR